MTTSRSAGMPERDRVAGPGPDIPDRGGISPAITEPGAVAGPAPEDVAWGADGLVPAIVQDASDGTVLMLAWMDREALAATTATGLAHFHSRRRARLWMKGETSGNVLRVRKLALDCDRDAILVSADPAGPACHTGTRSCFDTGGSGGPPGGTDPADPAASSRPQGFGWLEELWTTIERRRAGGDPDRSYTARLLAGGVDACGRKVTEEATEVLLAARDDAEAERAGAVDEAARLRLRAALAGEIADLLYHVLVLAAERDLPPAEIIDVLRARHRP